MKGNWLFWIIGGVMGLAFLKTFFTGWRVTVDPRTQPTPSPKGAGVVLTAADHAWTKPALAARLFADLASEGFVDAGTFRMDPLDSFVRLFAHGGDAVAAVVYDCTDGPALELVSRYADGTTFTMNDQPPTGLGDSPGHREVSVPGASAADLLARVRAERPAGELLPETIDNAVGLYEEFCAAEMKGATMPAPAEPSSGQSGVRVSIHIGK